MQLYLLEGSEQEMNKRIIPMFIFNFFEFIVFDLIIKNNSLIAAEDVLAENCSISS